jgi:hypothetical protein
MFEIWKRRNEIMFLRITSIAVSALALSSVANADIVYSGDVSLEAEVGDSVSFDIAGYNYEFGIQTGGPLEYAYVTTTDENAGIFIPLAQTANPMDARNFADGDNIGTLTSVLDMFPLGNGSENINLNMYDFISGEGGFTLDETGYVGFGFGNGIDFNYGWIEFTVFDEGPFTFMTMTGWAYNDEVNGSITVGQIPAPGALGLLAIGGLAGRRRRG